MSLSKRWEVNTVPVAHACNLSYLGGWDQEDDGSRSAWANSLWDLPPISKITRAKWRCGSSGRVPTFQVWSPKVKSHYHQKQTNEKDVILKKKQKHDFGERKKETVQCEGKCSHSSRDQRWGGVRTPQFSTHKWRLKTRLIRSRTGKKHKHTFSFHLLSFRQERE
jgi:hypothetical protein